MNPTWALLSWVVLSLIPYALSTNQLNWKRVERGKFRKLVLKLLEELQLEFVFSQLMELGVDGILGETVNLQGNTARNASVLILFQNMVVSFVKEMTQDLKHAQV